MEKIPALFTLLSGQREFGSFHSLGEKGPGGMERWLPPFTGKESVLGAGCSGPMAACHDLGHAAALLGSVSVLDTTK